MRRTTCIGLLLFLATALAQDQREDNGFWWVNNSDSFKLGYVSGYAEAMTVADDTQFFRCIAAKNGGTLPEKYPGDEVLHACKEVVGPQFDYTQIRMGQLKEGVDEFYKDFRNKSIHIKVALGYVRDQLRGEKSAKQLEDELTMYRRNAAKAAK